MSKRSAAAKARWANLKINERKSFVNRIGGGIRKYIACLSHEEIINKSKKGGKASWAGMSPQERSERVKKGINQERNKKLGNSIKKYWSGLTQKERQKRILGISRGVRRKNKDPKHRQKYATATRKSWLLLTDERYQERTRGISRGLMKWWLNVSPEKKLGMALKRKETILDNGLLPLRERAGFENGTVVPSVTETPRDILLHEEQSKNLENGLRLLTKVQRRIVEQVALEGKSIPEICADSGFSQSQLAKEYSTAITVMRSYLSRIGYVAAQK